MVLLTMVMTNNILFGQSELEDFTKSETELSKLNKKELREYVSFLENISDSLLRKKNDNIVGLQSQLKEKKSRIISIENEIVKLKTLQSKLESEKSKLESEKSELESEKTKLESEKSELENKLENLSILVSKNNEELNLLRKLNGLENDTTKNNQNIKEKIGDGCIESDDESLSYYTTDHDFEEDLTDMVEIEGKRYKSGVGLGIFNRVGSMNSSFIPNYGVNQYSKMWDIPIFQFIVRKDGELYTGCVTSTYSKERTIGYFENGHPTLWEHYKIHPTTGDEHLMEKIEFKDGVPHGRWFEKVFLRGIEGSDDYMENPILFREGFYNNGLVDGDWKEFQYQDHYDKTRLRYLWKFDKGERIGTWVQNNYVGKLSDFKEGETSSTYETTFYRNQILTKTKYVEGKFQETEVWGYYEPLNRHTQLHYFNSSKFPDYDGSGKHDILDKYIEEGKSQIDKMLVDNNLPK